MQKNIIGIGALLALIIAVGIMFVMLGDDKTPANGNKDVALGMSPLDATYTISGNVFTLANGTLERPVAPGSSAVEKIMVFGTPSTGDLDMDGDMDAALLLAQETGGSGTFYYVALAINEGGKYAGTNAMLLGDRIAPQGVDILGGRAVANFAVRNAGEPFTTPPSVGKSVWVHLDIKTGQIGEFVQGFEGEADASKMSLGMNAWKWVGTTWLGGRSSVPAKKDAFTLTFNADGTFSMTTDCNNGGGSYAVTPAKNISFDKMMSTKMFCEGAQEAEFIATLGGVDTFKFTGKGELSITLKNGGTMLFRGI